MSTLEIIIRLAVLVPLFAYLFWKRRQRERRRLAEYEASLQRIAGLASPIQIATLAPRVRQVREDYLSAFHAPLGDARHKAARVASARAAASRKNYFRQGDMLEDHASGRTWTFVLSL